MSALVGSLAGYYDGAKRAPIVAQHTGNIRYHLEAHELDADSPRYRGTPAAGSLWERASYEDRLERGRNGYLLAYYVTSRDGGMVTRRSFATREEAEAHLATEHSATAARFFGYRVTLAHYFTKGGKVLKFT